jgi:peptidoglycan hydrolase-like protein with peptidoglycan-binding domain
MTFAYAPGRAHRDDPLLPPSVAPALHAKNRPAAIASPQRLMAERELLGLQMTAGNRAVSQLFERPQVQRCGPRSCNCPEHERDDAAKAPTVQRVLASELSTTGEPAEGAPQQGPGVLSRGSAGPAVRLVQELLNASGILPEPIDADGVFGPATEAAVVAFQEAMGLSPDGIVGPITDQTLRATAGPAPGIPGGGIETPGSTPGSTPGEAPVETPSGGPPQFASGCKYNPGEKERSAADPGGTVSPAQTVPNPADARFLLSNSFGITGFTQGSADLKARHIEFIAEMTKEFRLDTPEPSHLVERVVGFTDCVDSFAKNVGIRLRRADALRAGLLSQGALEQNLGHAEASPEGAQVTSGNGERDRASNRAAVANMTLRETAKPQPPVPPFEETPDESCERPSKKWIFEQKGSAGGGFGAMGQVLTFHVTNVETGCVHIAEFVAGGFGAGGGVDVSIPSPLPEAADVIELPREVFAFELDGEGGLAFGEASLGVGFGIGKILMLTGPLFGEVIDVGGLQIGEGIEGGVLGGHLNVHFGGRKAAPGPTPPTA